MMTELTPVHFAIIWLACAIVAGLIADRKGEGILGFIIGGLLGPLGILIAFASVGNRMKCPNCLENMNKKAKVCPYCQRDVKPA